MPFPIQRHDCYCCALLPCLQEAEQSYHTALKLKSKYSMPYITWINLGNLVIISNLGYSIAIIMECTSLSLQYKDTGRPNDAINAFKSAIAIKRNNRDSWTKLALVLETIGL